MPGNDDVSLKEYVDLRFTESDKAKENALHSMEEARKDSLAAMEKRLEGMNEFRDQLRDQASRFITREEYSSGHKPLEEKISEKLSVSEYRAFCDATNAILEDYKINKAVLATKAGMNSVLWGYAFTAITLVIAIISIVLRIMGK